MSLSSERCRLWRDIKVVNTNDGDDDDWGERSDDDGSDSSSVIALPRGVFVDLVRALLQPSSIVSDNLPLSSSVIDDGDEDSLVQALTNGHGVARALIHAKSTGAEDGGVGGDGGGGQQGTLGALLAGKMLHSQGC